MSIPPTAPAMPINPTTVPMSCFGKKSVAKVYMLAARVGRHAQPNQQHGRP